MIAASVVTFILTAPPAPTCGGPPLGAEQAAAAAKHATALREAEAKATEDPEHGNALLESTLAAAAADAEVVARDPDAREARQYAMLALARGMLAADRKADAAAIVDAALATSGGVDLPVKLFGPSLVTLHGQRKQALMAGGMPTLRAECAGTCMVIVDAALAGCAVAGAPLELPMPAGEWEVLLVDTEAVEHRIAKRITLGASGSEVVSLAPRPVDTTKRGRRSGESGASDGRKLPRWAGIVGISVGVLALVGGGVLLAVDGSCPDGTDPMGEGACQNILNTDVPGYVMMGVGAAATVGFSVALGIGEVKQKRARQGGARASLGPGRLVVRF